MSATTDTNLIDTGAIRAHHQLVWGSHQWPADAALAVTHRAVGRVKMYTERVPVQDADAFCALVASKARQGEVWVNVAPQPITTERRGGKKDAIALPALFADVDIDTGAHKAIGSTLPTEAEALEIIGTCPLQPTLLVRTGGGYHVWVALDTPVDHRTPEGEEVLKRWKLWWESAFAARSLHVDAGVLADVARMLRIAGTANHKIPGDVRPVSLVGEPGVPVSLAEVLDSLPPLPVQLKSATPSTRLPVSATPSKGDTDDDARPGSLLRRQVPVGDLLEPVLGLVRLRDVDGGARWRAPDSEAGDGDAQTYPGDDGIETVTVFCDVLAASLGMSTDHRTWDSWGLLIHQCGDDAHLAARVARQCPDVETLTAALVTHTTAEALESAFPEHVDVGEITVSVPEAIAAMAGNVIQIGHNTHVVIGGPNHGLYITKTVERNGEKKTYEEKITDWIAWPAEVMTRLRINDRCHPETVGDEEYTCEVVTSTGRHYVRPGYAAKDAASASTVIDTCHAGVELPVSQSHVKVANNMLRTLGHNDQRKNAEYASMGWCYVDGETPVYLAPHGSITPDGVIDSYTVGAYGGDDAGLGAAMRRTGFADATLPVHEAAKAIELFCKIAPHRPEIAIALIGLMASAPLRLSTRAVVVITGETDAGKTLLSSAVQTFFADVAVGQKEAASLYIPSSSPVGAAGVTAWYRDGLAVCDDYRRDDSNKQANETMAQILSTVVQAAYGAAPSAKATQTGGMRESRDQAASALITAEVSADQSAIRNRGITLTLAKVDRVTTPGGAIDIFKRAADTGAARSLMAHYITYLARRATMYPDGLARMKKAMTTRSQRNYVSLSRTTGGRASETVAALMTGWETFREFAKDAGIESVLPSKKTVETALRSLAASNASLAAEADPGRRVLDQMAAMLAGNTAHLVAHHGGQPDLDGHSLGWVATTTHSFSGTTTRWDAKGPMLGTLSEDGTVVVVGKTGVQAAMPGARLDGLAPSQVYEALGRLTVQGTNPGGHCPTSLGIKSRPEGYVVPVALLGIGFASDETPEPEFESELELEHDTF